MNDDTPEEDRYLANQLVTNVHEHEYVDFYCGWGPAKDDPGSRLVWIYCKKCLDRKQIRLNMHNVDMDYDE